MLGQVSEEMQQYFFNNTWKTLMRRENTFPCKISQDGCTFTLTFLELMLRQKSSGKQCGM